MVYIDNILQHTCVQLIINLDFDWAQQNLHSLKKLTINFVWGGTFRPGSVGDVPVEDIELVVAHGVDQPLEHVDAEVVPGCVQKDSLNKNGKLFPRCHRYDSDHLYQNIMVKVQWWWLD